MQDTRRSRINVSQRQFYSKFGEIIRNASSISERERLISKLGNICEVADHFDAMSEKEQ
ncbi:MAG: hypothetical protein K9W44_12060 [Candidatus Lokiarchaeota archaeon]|nr:hypothetical protein [Candidatus Harpocratesius repetitus]